MASALPQKEQSKNVKNLTIETDEKTPALGETSVKLKEPKEPTQIIKEPSKNDNENPSVQPTPTPSSGSDNNTNTQGGFKVPKKKTNQDTKGGIIGNEATGMQKITSTDSNNSTGGTPKLNHNVISNLNKSLKAKQKIINSKEPHPKNSNIISELINSSPKASSFPSNISSSINENENESNAHTLHGTGAANLSINVSSSSNANVNEQNSKPTTLKEKNKRIAKQNSTRTDFFAAKLASAVDDVDSSDSDETFVYENNANEFEKNTSHNPNSRIPQSDNASINGSITNTGGIATTLNSPPILEENSDGGNALATESIHSVHSSKIPTIRSTNNSVPPSENINTTSPSDLFRSRPQQQRTGSTYSIPHLPAVIQNNEDKLHHPDTAVKNNTAPSDQAPASPYAFQNKSSSSHGLLSSDKFPGYVSTNPQPNTAATSINDGYNEDRYSYDEVDDTDIIDDSGDEEFYSSQRINDATHTSQNNALTGYNPVSNFGSDTAKDENCTNNRSLPNASVASKSTSKKNHKSSTSSKLRSTTSKLFDKKGSQPRRYSIIPDDVDIEDFDDELIYYDNNIRFPHNGNSNPSNNTVNFNDSLPLHNHNHRIPHYRSLNLNFLGKRNTNIKNKRYLSTGQPIAPNHNNDMSSLPITANNNHPNKNIFPFPYPEPHQKYYCDIDEYEEEPLNEYQDEEAQFCSPNSRKVSGNSKRPFLKTSNSHFLLPRKQSIKNQKVNNIKKFIYTLMSITCILGVGFMMGFILATTKELTNVSIKGFENPIVSQDELLFNVIVEGFNPGWFAVDIEEVELDIFAKSGYLSETNDLSNLDLVTPNKKSVETVLLGTITNLESPMTFAGGFFTRELVRQSGEIKLLRPGRNLTNLEFDKPEDEPDNSDKWEIIAKNPFDLIVRGILKYNLPMTKNSKSVVVSKVGYIDPNQDNF